MSNLRCVIAAAAMLVGCASSTGIGFVADAAMPTLDAANPCTVAVTFTPSEPIAGAGQVVIANAVASGVQGFATYQWNVGFGDQQLDVTPLADGSTKISFPIENPGTYHVSLAVSAATQCNPYDDDFNVLAQGANTSSFRLDIVPPTSSATPPYENVILISGGADVQLSDVVLPSGVQVEGSLLDNQSQPVAAYVRFAPLSTPDSIVETYAATDGAYHATLPSGGLQRVLVIPNSPALAPQEFPSWTPLVNTLAVDAGTVVDGTVVDPSGAPLAGARVTITMGDVPSTIATSGSDGAFSLRIHPPTLGAIIMTVVPPTTTGLPTLLATLGALPNSAATISYSPSTTLVDLGGLVLQRAGSPVAAQLDLLGSSANAGTISIGASSTVASGRTHAIITTTSSGIIASGSLVPAIALDAVAQTSDGAAGSATSSVSSIEFGTLAPSTIDIAEPAPFTFNAVNAAGFSVPGARLIAIPTGSLGLASMTPVIAVANEFGVLSSTLAAGATYDIRIDDPSEQSAPLRISGVTAGSLGTVALPAAIRLHGNVLLANGNAALHGAAIALYCVSCTGSARQQPIAEAASDATGAYTLVVVDPGVAGH